MNIIDRMKANSQINMKLTYYADKARAGPSTTNVAGANKSSATATSGTSKLYTPLPPQKLSARRDLVNLPAIQPDITSTQDIATLISNLQTNLQKGLDELNERIDRREEVREGPYPRRKHRRNEWHTKYYTLECKWTSPAQTGVGPISQ